MNASRDRSTASVQTPKAEVRGAVKNLLTRSAAFNQLPPEKQRQVARDTALIADYLAAPEGIPANKIPGGVGTLPPPPTARALGPFDSFSATPGSQPPPQASYEEASEKVSEIGEGKFAASAAREGAEVAGLLMQKVNFPVFVAGLIEGVFHAIVKSSIEQMEAYAKMVGEVAKSLEQFRDENVTDNQGRDHMVEKFPDLFEIGFDDFAETPGPKLKLRDGIEESDALKKVRGSLKFEEGEITSMDLSDEAAERSLVVAAKTQLAKQRQQLLASLVMLGINRIVVTDGRISAKIMYDFQARDSRSLRRSAAAYDYARAPGGQLATMWEGEGTYDTGGSSARDRQRNKDTSSDEWTSDYYAKGDYKYAQKPVMSAMSTATEASDSALQARAQLSGAVEVNFKSDYLPLDKMATPGMIAAIQGNSRPVDPNVVPSAVNREPGKNGAAGATGSAPGATATSPATA
jgi:hypothetical protein